ncbi:MAG: hypothetical protein IPJ90_09965 [Anaerolineaceae bacterium]|nr:hypothetical protein [Anaerolineaceae bacterium]
MNQAEVAAFVVWALENVQQTENLLATPFFFIEGEDQMAAFITIPYSTMNMKRFPISARSARLPTINSRLLV